MLRNNADAHISSLGYLWENLEVNQWIVQDIQIFTVWVANQSAQETLSTVLVYRFSQG